MSRSPRFSAVLANYNGARYLDACVESVLAQSERKFEFIVVDDGSTDGSAEILRRWADRDPRIRYLQQDMNRGQAEAFNRAVALARGELMSFIDSDDLWFPDKLAIVGAGFGDPSRVTFHQHHLQVLQGETLLPRTFRDTLAIGDVFGRAVQTRSLPEFVPTSGLTFARQVLLEVGPVPAAFRTCADGYLTRTAMCHGRVSGSDICGGAYRVHGGNQTYGNPGFDVLRYLRELLLPNVHAYYGTKAIGLRYVVPAVEAGAVDLRVLRLDAGESVLMLRSAPPARVERVLAALFAANPQVRVDLLVQPGFSERFGDTRISALEVAAGPLAAASISVAVRERLATSDYVAVLVPYNELDGRNYGNIHEVLAGLAFRCPVLGVGSDGSLHPVLPRELRKVGAESTLGANDERRNCPGLRHGVDDTRQNMEGR